MGATDRPDPAGASTVRTAAGDSPAADATRDCGPEIAVGSWEHLQAAFARAATVADRAVGLWLARGSPGDRRCALTQPTSPTGQTPS